MGNDNDDDFIDDLLVNPALPTDQGSAEAITLPPLSEPETNLLRAVASRAATNGQIPPLRALISAYDNLAAEYGVNAGYSAPVLWGYLLRVAEGAGLDELVKEQRGPGGSYRKNRPAEKL